MPRISLGSLLEHLLPGFRGNYTVNRPKRIRRSEWTQQWMDATLKPGDPGRQPENQFGIPFLANALQVDNLGALW